MASSVHPNISYVHPLFPTEHLAANWGKLHKMIPSPSHLAAGIHISLDEARKADLKLSKEDTAQIVKVYNAAVADGRYLGEFTSNPQDVANKLNQNVKLSQAAINAIHTAAGFAGARQPGGAVQDPVSVVCVAVVVVLTAGMTPGSQMVVDPSGAMKL